MLGPLWALFLTSNTIKCLLVPSFTAAFLLCRLKLTPFCPPPRSGWHFQLSGSITLQIPLVSEECILETIFRVRDSVERVSVFPSLTVEEFRCPGLFTRLPVLPWCLSLVQTFLPCVSFSQFHRQLYPAFLSQLVSVCNGRVRSRRAGFALA